MKHNELRELWEERLDSVKSGITRKGFFKEIDSVAKEVGGKLTDEDIAVISEIHKDLNDYRLLDDDQKEKDKNFDVLHKLTVIREFLEKVGKTDVAASLECGMYENYPYPKRQPKTKEQTKEEKPEYGKTDVQPERKTAKEIVMDSRKEIADKILESMKSGELMWRKDWQKLAPYNGKTGRNYHGINQVRLFVESVSRGLDDPRFMTYKQAEEQGYNVKKGAQGIMLENWQFTKDQPVLDEAGNVQLGDDGKPLTETVQLEKPIVTYFKVFNAKDIEGIEPLPKLDVEREPVKNELINNVLGSSRCEIKEEVQDRAYYRVDEDRIVIPPRENFTSLDAFLATALHEMAHSTGHESCLNRELTGKFGSEEYAKEELRAELAAAFTQVALGVPVADVDTENHGAYIQSWIGALENNYNEFFMAVSDADKIAGVLEQNYEDYCIEHGLEKEQNKSLGVLINKDGINVTINDGIATFSNTTEQRKEVSINGMGMVMEPGKEVKFNTKNPEVKALIDAIKENKDSLAVVEVMDDPEKKRRPKKDQNLALAE